MASGLCLKFFVPFVSTTFESSSLIPISFNQHYFQLSQYFLLATSVDRFFALNNPMQGFPELPIEQNLVLYRHLVTHFGKA